MRHPERHLTGRTTLSRIQPLERRTLLDGLTGQYFNRMDFTEPVLTRIDPTVDFTWSGSPASGVRADFVSVRWTGQVRAPTNDTYTFYTTADDGVRLWVDGRLIIDNWQNQGATDRSASVALEAGQRYDIRLDYYEYDFAARIGLSWSSSLFSRITIPSPALFSQGSGLVATYFNDTNFSQPALSRTDTQVNFSWPTGSPDPAIAADGFSTRWSGQVVPAYSQTYRFYVTPSGSGATTRLRVDGKLIVDSANATRDGRITLEASKRYDIVLEYSDPSGPAGVTLEWSSPGEARQIIPASRFYAATPTSIPTARAVYHNPIIDLDRPDPGVIIADGAYWMVHTSGGPANGWPLWRSTDQVNWSFQRELLTAANRRSWMNGDYWAPEIHKVGGNFILTGTSTDSRTGRLTIAMASSPTINGTYTVRSEPIVSDSRSVLDSNIFIDDDGTPYLVWKRDGPSGGTFGSIRIRKLDATGLNFAAGSSETVILDNETAGWERNLAEAPWLVRRADAYYLFYSGAFIDTTYSLGVARGTSLTTMFARNPANPILTNNATWGGPGHGAFTLDLDGTLYHQYHARLMSDPNAGRKQLLDPVIWTASGWPSFGNGGTPTSINQGPRAAAGMAATAYSFSGDASGTATDDVFRVVRSTINSSMLEIYLNGGMLKTAPYAEILSLSFDGKSGNDTLELDASLGEVVTGAGITFVGGSGLADRIRWIGQTTGSPLRAIQSGRLAQGSGLVIPSGVEQLETLAGAVRLQADLNLVAPGAISLSASSTSISIEASQHVRSLSLSTGALAILNAQALVTGALSIDATSKLDLGTNALVVDYTGVASPVDSIETLVRNARGTDVAWTHPGITSSLASGDSSGRTIVGTAEATEMFGVFPAPFAGQFIDNTSVVVRATIAGDLDLNGNVSFNDLLTLTQHFGAVGQRYAQGNVDFSQDGSVVFDDLLLLAQWYGQTFVTAPVSGNVPVRSRKSLRGTEVAAALLE